MQALMEKHRAKHGCCQKPESLDLQELKKWYKEYKKADSLALITSEILNPVKEDELNAHMIEECIAMLESDITVTNRFCSHCQQLLDNWPDSRYPNTVMSVLSILPFRAHAVARDRHTLVLEAAGRKGCNFCGLITQRMKDRSLLDIYRRIEARQVYLQERGMARLSIRNTGYAMKQVLESTCLRRPTSIDIDSWVLKQSSESDCVTFYRSDATDVNTFDEPLDVLEQTRQWLQICSEQHVDCKYHGPPTASPTRLLFVGEGAPRLVLRTQWKTTPLYATLSHCWGTEDFLKLTADTYDAFLQEIPMETLPKSFQDAIHITKQIGLHYLWIDSLCIIQGDVKDWQREAALMSSVYGGSFVNIAAASAKHAREGCFLKPDNLVEAFGALVSENGRRCVRTFEHGSAYDMSVTKSYLATRAWTFQEKMLSPRTVHFGNRGVMWECRSLVASEYLPDKLQSLPSWTMLEQLTVEGRLKLKSRWEQIVEYYSTADLTYSGDKLPALAGVARRIYEQYEQRYIAGMWRDTDFEGQLCWSCHEPHARPKKWRSPSWSWTSVDGKIKFPIGNAADDPRNLHASVLEADVDLTGEDPFGQICGGSLRMACSGLLEGHTSRQLIENPSRPHEVRFVTEDAKQQRYIDLLFCWDSLDDLSSMSTEPVYILPILGKGRYELLNGIILRHDTGSGHFKRCGSFFFSSDYANHEKSYKVFLKALARRGKAVAERVCTEMIEPTEYPDHRYVIVIE